MKKIKNLLFFCFSLMLTYNSLAQEKTITGTVMSASDKGPLPGVSVIISNTAIGAETNFDGKYSIKATKGDVLVFSFVGMKTKSVTVNDVNVIDVSLENGNVLDEVVVTALGVKKEKKALGYAVTNVKNDELERGKDPNVVNSLQGKVAGIDINQASAGVGAANRVVIRGNSSITGSNQALYVVDGVPISNNESEGEVDEWGNGVSLGNGIADINPDDIESISVLKGANAAALYGSRAANGVIMITTKKGKAGKVSFGFNSSVTFDEIAYYAELQNTYGQGSFGAIPSDIAGLRSSSSCVPKMDGSNQLLWTGETGAYSAQPDNIKNFYKGGSTITNSFYVEGGSEKLTARVSYTRSDISGIVPNNELQRNSFSVYTKLNMGKLDVDLKGNYINQNVNNRPALSYWTDNTVFSLYSMPRNVSLSALKANIDNDYLSSVYNNPYHATERVGTNDKKNRVFGFVSAKYNFTDNFKAMFRAGTDYSSQNFLSYIPIGHISIGNGQVTQNTYTNQETNIDFLLTYNRKLNEDIGMSVSAGGNRLEKRNTIEGTIGSGIIFPGIYNVRNTDSRQPHAGTGEYTSKVNSVYGTLDFDYKNFLFAQFTARNDWSSVLPLSNNSFFYPSVSVSGILSDMFDIKNDSFNYWKVRASWAQVGSDGDISPYDVHPRYVSGNPYLGNGTATTTTLKPNLNLKPQITTSLEFGTDLRLFKNKLDIELSVYNTKTVDQVLELTAPVDSGYERFLVNEGAITNKGIEVDVNYKVINNENFTWKVGANFAKNDTEVSGLSTNQLPLAIITGNTSFNISAINNGGYGEIVGNGYRRNDQGQILVGSSGLPLQSLEQKSFGNFNPDWTGGLTNTFTYKDFSLSFLISSKMGGKILSRTDMILDLNGNSKRTLKGRETGIIVPNSVDEVTGVANIIAVPAQTYYNTVAGSNIIEDYVYDADYIKLKELSIGYKFPEELTSKIKVSSASIRFIARNLFFFDRSTDSFDPEVSGFNTRNAQGIELLSLPGTRSYGVNLSVKF
ncbi:SusC/RagA family TonB-linked outer membrane protein [Tenacibaculum retecalamus]|uniref:SusC/RagA family TonB-linked outer membrane protein n=1 Tax=Tenacibaculum retecalamus TaxID=3018315 RepID=UPI0023D96F7C|nr:SusC/RagA family TonB-linked outer membrane protein [Tenacibaculum retecalamus]WBX70507.1 SusC/RagA family TonB-linked outer membrane protein [Tenacibaculum retecalamus]